MRILEYHSVQPTSECPFMLKCDEFENHIKFHISKGYDFIDFRENKSLNLNNKKVLITFDDGYLDNYTYVFPIIKKYNIPIIIFLATDYINKTMQLDTVTLKMLSEKHIKEMYDSGLVYFASHTHTHCLVDKIRNENDFSYEIKKSKSFIKNLLEYECQFFCYPKGRINNAYKYILKKEFLYAVTTQYGCADSTLDKLLLPRIEILNSDYKLEKYFKLHCHYFLLKITQKIKNLIYKVGKRCNH